MDDITKFLTVDEQGRLRFNNEAIGTQGGGITLPEDQASTLEIGMRVIAALLKQPSGDVVLDATVEMLDETAPLSVAAYLADDQPWGNIPGFSSDYIQIQNADNGNGQLGQQGQHYEVNSTFYFCKSHVRGDSGLTNGSAVWVRNRSRDCLQPLNVNGAPNIDQQIVSQLVASDGWNENETKVIAVRSKVGSWYTAATGYMYMCFDDTVNSWYWRRFLNTPNYIPMELNPAAHGNLIASLQAHDFSTGFYTEGTNSTDEAAEQGQEYWDLAGNKVYKRNSTGKWSKISA